MPPYRSSRLETRQFRKAPSTRYIAAVAWPETSRLRLREWRPREREDVEAAFAIYSDPEVMRWLGDGRRVIGSREEQREVLEARSAVNAGLRDGSCYLAVERLSDGRVIGAVIFRELPDGEDNGTGDYEIGWHFAQEFWGQGFATEASQALLEHAFATQPALAEVYAVTKLDNERSVRVMERLGMECLGTTQKYYGVETLLYRKRR
ncbi:MAG: GNAT family N-acetyltransferase [Fimbriimonadaceae bacterium]|nr:GNAT family N-acetyltransferase [Fimbriimonadaceae bacterium]QYK56422.1 MAG: GNAT family N-acetyltransferase [Fimbriimonadaceae bacterium]